MVKKEDWKIEKRLITLLALVILLSSYSAEFSSSFEESNDTFSTSTDLNHDFDDEDFSSETFIPEAVPIFTLFIIGWSLWGRIKDKKRITTSDKGE